MTDRRDDGRADESDAITIDAVPVPVMGYDASAGTPEIAVTNDAFDATFDAASTGTNVREWLRRSRAVDESEVAAACDQLAAGNAIDIEVGVRTGDAERRPIRLRSVGRSSDDDTSDGADGGDAVDGYVLITELKPTSADPVEFDRVASVITHDLRNPLDVAKAHLRAARETGETDHFDQVEEAHDRMERIIRDALTLARGDRAIDASENVAIDAVASDAWATVETEAASLEVAEDLPRLDADPDRLQRLFENLFRNAVEHGSTNPGSAAGQDTEHSSTDGPDATESACDEPVRVRVESADRGFIVADDGPGIPADERERVFEPGYSSTDAGGGTGLGLTIVEQIAHAHDWTVSVAEGACGGATFEFRPITDDD
ncbi:sensor histidine kinase [Natrinema thermotolerans]|uniref:sensor histidine kinase n=1 Tax=Natrinema thermotolerans TaxID=121872 RepID=UPI000678816B|nr:HAMP domain-containing sensor histidine kinase [Natrinema thermotolerans]QCC61794.1 sensor histidine kinase [Natrinema thermotolerans]